MKWTVPAFPTIRGGGNAPGWWFGIEDTANEYLIQPILAYGDGVDAYTIFNGYWQWPTGELPVVGPAGRRRRGRQHGRRQTTQKAGHYRHTRLPINQPRAAENWWQSDSDGVRPGDVISSSLTYDATSNSYNMVSEHGHWHAASGTR